MSFTCDERMIESSRLPSMKRYGLIRSLHLGSEDRRRRNGTFPGGVDARKIKEQKAA